MIDFTLLVMGSSVVAGVLGALLGLGGGTFIVPALTLFFNVPIHAAAGASIVSVIATSTGAASAYVHDRVSNVRLGVFLTVATTTGALIGAFLVGVVSTRFLYVIFALLLGYSAVAIFQKRGVELPEGVRPDPLARRFGLNGAYYDKVLARRVDYSASGVVPGFAIMFVAGLTSGLLGIGSGLLKVLGMDVAMKLPMKVSTATSNFMIGITAATTAAAYFFRGYIQPGVAAPVAIGVLVGSVLGPQIMSRVRNTTLRKIFLPVVLYVAADMLLKGLGR
jgi:uncharacterized membrane protein YfcA